MPTHCNLLHVILCKCSLFLLDYYVSNYTYPHWSRMLRNGLFIMSYFTLTRRFAQTPASTIHAATNVLILWYYEFCHSHHGRPEFFWAAATCNFTLNYKSFYKFGGYITFIMHQYFLAEYLTKNTEFLYEHDIILSLKIYAVDRRHSHRLYDNW